MSQKRIVLVGGGSGGHFYPLIAVAEKLKNMPEVSLYYMGPNPYDAQALRENNITFVKIPSGKQRKYRSFLNILDVFKIALGTLKAIVSLYIIYPDVIFSKGGYTSVPVTVAGFLLRIPIVIHESDTKPGSANKLAARFARYIAVAFPETAAYFKKDIVAHTGIPLRDAVLHEAKDPHQVLGIDASRPLICITGGSQGAVRINDLVLEALDELLPAFSVLHQTGVLHESTVSSSAASLIENSSLLSNYYVKGSLTETEMSAAMSASALIISRAGTGTIFEIAYKGKPSILIPIPEAISHDQRTNAYAYARRGACSVLEEHNLTDGLLVSEIMRIMGDQDVYTRMGTQAQSFSQAHAKEKIAELLLSLSETH
jgi:UDP-N-acetylglucosamine--N-acetylmuramyl-(pentapeptide) pyrophosphoryl-undecaprenol N-acetylglucosamine transferase